jgi:chromosomal replication initiation ATPase DnaA
MSNGKPKIGNNSTINNTSNLRNDSPILIDMIRFTKSKEQFTITVFTLFNAIRKRDPLWHV